MKAFVQFSFIIGTKDFWCQGIKFVLFKVAQRQPLGAHTAAIKIPRLQKMKLNKKWFVSETSKSKERAVRVFPLVLQWLYRRYNFYVSFQVWQRINIGCEKRGWSSCDYRKIERTTRGYSLLLILFPLLEAQNRLASYKGLSKLLPAPAKWIENGEL